MARGRRARGMMQQLLQASHTWTSRPCQGFTLASHFETTTSCLTRCKRPFKAGGLGFLCGALSTRVLPPKTAESSGHPQPVLEPAGATSASSTCTKGQPLKGNPTKEPFVLTVTLLPCPSREGAQEVSASAC